MDNQEKLNLLTDMSFHINEALPADICLKGDGSFWVRKHNKPVMEKVTQEQVLEMIYKAMKISERMISA